MHDMVASKPNEPTPPSITSVWITPSSPSVTVGSSVTLTATVIGTGSYNSGVTWTSSNAQVASVATDGTVRGHTAGSAWITATSDADPSKTSQTNVVVDIPKRDGQDEIDASKAPLMEHLIELRQRLIYSLFAFFGMFIVCFIIARPIFNILLWPFVAVVGEDKAKLIATHFLEQLFTNIKLAMFGAAFLSFPFAAYQLYKFVAPGLYKNEKDAFRPYLLWTWLLFIAGALVVYFVVMPLLIRFSVEMTPQAAGGGHAGIELLPKVSEYLSLIMTLIMGFGIIFQLPVILALLAQAGIVTSQNLKDFSRYAIVAIAAVSAVLSPPDPFSMIAMMAPTVGLYYVAIWVVQRIEKKAT